MKRRHPRATALCLLAGALLYLGCQTPGFVRSGSDFADFYEDLRECEAESWPQWSLCYGRECDVQRERLERRRDQCLVARGWQISNSAEAFRP